MRKYEPIFSGRKSVDMWQEINSARTIRDLRSALYTVCCQLQELESRIEKIKIGEATDECHDKG